MFNYVPLSSKTFWQFSVDAINIGTYAFTKSQQAISDTSTSFLGGPRAQIAGIVAAINAKWDDDNGVYFVSCTQSGLPDIVFTIGGQKYNIPSTEYVIDVVNFAFRPNYSLTF